MTQSDGAGQAMQSSLHPGRNYLCVGRPTAVTVRNAAAMTRCPVCWFEKCICKAAR